MTLAMNKQEKLQLLSIDLMKALAVLLIINHRIPLSYCDYSMLATGGALGCSLFFFISGYTLFASKISTFSDWIKSRLGRLYPSIWMVLTLKQICFSDAPVSVFDYLCAQSYWFIECIIIYYFVFFFIRKWFSEKMFFIMVLSIILYIIASLLFFDYDQSIYASNRLKYILFFSTFLLGAIIRKNEKIIMLSRFYDRTYRCYWMFVILMLVFYLTYFVPLLTENRICRYFLQVLLYLPLVAWVFHVWVLFRRFDARLNSEKNKPFITVIRWVSFLSLECFLIQSLFTREIEEILLCIYPFNIPIVFVVVLFQAYILRCLTRFFFGLVGANDFSPRSILAFTNSRLVK